jgi:long-chain acyl-CoA synthetase
MPTRQTVLSYLEDYASRGSSIVFAQRRGLRTIRCSYKRLLGEARRFARELEARDIQHGERVLLCGDNSVEWVTAFWGCCLRGAVVVPLDKGSSAEFVVTVARQTEPKIMLADRDVSAEHLRIPVVRLEGLSQQIACHASTPYAVDGIDEETVVEIIYTSGTTSDPKGVVLTHRNLLANLLPLEPEIEKYLKWEWFFHPIRFLNLIPLSHVFGQFMGLFVPQLLGGEVHFQKSFNPSEIVRAIKRNRISVMVVVPRVFYALREWVERDYAARGQAEQLHEQLSAMAGKNFLRQWWTFRRLHRRFGWKFWAFVSGGARLDEQTEMFWRRLGFAVLQGYGMTETAALISVNHPFKMSQGSIGKLMPSYEVKLDQHGEIIVRGDSVSPGYWTAEGAVKASADGWLHTGDIGQMDASGNLFFKGRQKDVIVTGGGLNIYPEDLEAVLNTQPEIRASCVIAVEGRHGGEPLAVIIPRHRNVSLEAAIERANAQLTEYQKIRRWFIWTEPDFPRTATHKVLKREIAAKISSAEGRTEDKSNGGSLPSVPAKSTTAAATVLASEIARISGEPAQFSASDRLADLQLDSIGRVELLSALEDRYQIALDEAAFSASTTVGDVEKVVRGEIQEQSVARYPYPKWPRWPVIKLIRIVLFYTIILPITYVMSRMRVEGRVHLENLAGPMLFVANHVTAGDHALILVGLPAHLRHRLVIAMEGEVLRDWLYPPASTGFFKRLRWLAQYVLVNLFFDVFPLPKQSGFRQSFAYAGECIDRGESLLVFPEGVRAPRGQMQMGAFKGGVGILAQELNVTIVPIKLDGLYELKRRRQYFASPGMVRVMFGAPLRFESDANPNEIAQELQKRVAQLGLNR